MTTTRIPTPRPTAPPAAARLALAIVESMLGHRPLHAMRSLLAPKAFGHLVRHREAGRFRNAVIGSTRYQTPAAGAAEICVQLQDAGRWLVCVLRLDHREGWSCTEFRVLGC